MHTPVLLQQSIEALNIQEGGRYIDATYGMGGHSNEIVAQGGHVLGIEWDADSYALRLAEIDSPQITLAHGNFADIAEIARSHDFVPVDGVLFDFGLSMWQIRESGRGFSYENDDEPLDMRIHALDKDGLTAADIINSYTESQLYDICTKYAEELDSRPIAHALVESRKVKRIETVGDLKRAIDTVRKDTATRARIFQALRIAVNDEFENIQKGLDGALSIVSPDGRIAVITFHPSEDRIVKRWIRSHENDVSARKKVIKAKDGERFERSAHLRILTKIM